MEPGTRNKEAAGPPAGFRKPLASQKADEMASAVFRLTRPMARDDRWLAVQLIRAAVSVPANIAEGHGRGSPGDYIRFLEIANPSLNEVEYYLHFLESNQIVSPGGLRPAAGRQKETGALPSGLMKSLRRRHTDGNGWQRGLVREGTQNYIVDEEGFDPGSSFLAPGS